jgi:hypothetical protein
LFNPGHLSVSREKRPKGKERRHVCGFCVFCGFLMLVAVLTGCGRRDNNGIKGRPALDHCLPQSGNEADWPSLAINGVKQEPSGTSVKLVAYALDKPARFDLPLYVMSAGRWLINNSDRAYLLDEECREYKLKDKKVSGGQKKVEEGRVMLKPGEAFEVTLVFTPISSDVTAGALVYGGQTMRFAVSP